MAITATPSGNGHPTNPRRSYDRITPSIPQEICLIERYTSAEYSEKLCAAFANTVQAAEEGLTEFVCSLPPAYRQHPRWQQPDITWGSVVLPNPRSTLPGVEAAYRNLQRGDSSAIATADGINSALAGQRRDFTYDWMPEHCAFRFRGSGRSACLYGRASEGQRRAHALMQRGAAASTYGTIAAGAHGPLHHAVYSKERNSV